MYKSAPSACKPLCQKRASDLTVDGSEPLWLLGMALLLVEQTVLSHLSIPAIGFLWKRNSYYHVGSLRSLKYRLSGQVFIWVHWGMERTKNPFCLSWKFVANKEWPGEVNFAELEPLAQRTFRVEVTYGQKVCKQVICITLVTGRNISKNSLLRDIGENGAEHISKLGPEGS